MLNLRLNLSIFRLPLFIVLLIGTSIEINAQNIKATEISEFRISVETSNDGIKLTCNKGCSWKELTFNISKTEKPRYINEHGMTSLSENKEDKESKLANFLISITKTKNGFTFEGIEGTSWKTLSFSCSNENYYQTIDQNGMTTDDIK